MSELCRELGIRPMCFVLPVEVFEHQANVRRIENVGTPTIPQRVDLAAQALGRRSGRPLQVLVLVRHA